MNKKYLKFSLIGTLLSGAIITASLTPPILLNNNQTNQINKSDAENYVEGDTNEFDYIKKDVEKQTGIENSVKSIDFAENASTANHSAAVVTKTDGSTILYTWGHNNYGQLGFTASGAKNPTPKRVTGNLVGKKITTVSLGQQHTAVLVEDGTLYMWGNNRYGQLGISTNSGWELPNATPTQIPISVFNNKKVIKIECGANFSVALTEDNKIYTWGNNDYSQLGGSSTSSYNSTPTAMATSLFPSTSLISDISAGGEQSAALLEDGSVYMWGRNNVGQLGKGTAGGSSGTPSKALLDGKVFKQVAVGWNHVVALIDDGSVYTWGLNDQGQLGVDKEANNWQPRIIRKYDNKVFTKISAGYSHSLALATTGELYAWGNNSQNQLGNESTTLTRVPTLVTTNTINKKISQIVAGQHHNVIITDDSTLYMWGSNSSGQVTGTANSITTPTWMSHLGFDSHITANTSITAKEAVDKFWIDNRFNLDGFRNSFNFFSIPDADNQIFTMDTKPTYDNKAKTVTIKAKNTYFYNEDGFNTATASVTVSDFMPSLTDIRVKDNPKNDIVIDKWLDSIKELTYIDRQKLEEYLTLENVPNDAIFTITIIDQNLSTGVLKFNITSSKTIKQDNTIIGESEPFPITLNLIARVTKVTPRTNYNKIVVNKLKDLIFDEAGVAKIAEINKYVEISAPIDGATLNLKPDSYVTNTGMGTTKFTVFYDKYYDANGDPQTQTAASIKQSFDISLQLKPMASVISSKSTYTPTHRVDRFMAAFTDDTGKVTDETILKQYIDIENMPTGYSLSIKDYNIIDSIAGTVSFTVVASNYNDLNFVPQTDGEFPIQLLKLLPKFPTTDISAKTEGDYDDTVRLDRFIGLFADMTTGVVNNIDKLGEFLDLVSIPEDATLTVKNIKMTNATGIITFDIEVSKYYDADSDLQNATKSFSIELNLGIKYIPTEITANKNIVYPERVDRFETKISELSGTPELQTYLQSKYITIVGDLPKNTTFSVSNIVGVNETGIINFDLTASAFYDENSDRIENKVIPLELSLRIKYAPTVLTAKPKEDYTAQDRVDRFEHNVKMFKDQDLKTYLSNYVDGINTLVVGSTLVASAVTSEITTGAISFSLTTNKYYDADSDLQVSDTTWTIALELGIKHEQTKVTSKTGDFTHIVVDQFIPLFTDEQLVVDDKTELNKYVDITALPADANLSVKDANMTFSTGMIIFKIVADKFYDGESDLITTFSQEYIIKLTLGIKYQATTVSAIKGYDQSENVETFANQIKTLTGDALKTYLDTYLQIKGDLPANAILSVDVDSITTDLETGKVSFNVQLDKYYDETGSLQSNGSFMIKLKLAF